MMEYSTWRAGKSKGAHPVFWDTRYSQTLGHHLVSIQDWDGLNMSQLHTIMANQAVGICIDGSIPELKMG